MKQLTYDTETAYVALSEDFACLRKALDYSIGTITEELENQREETIIVGLSDVLVCQLRRFERKVIEFHSFLISSLEYSYYDELCDMADDIEKDLRRLELTDEVEDSIMQALQKMRELLANVNIKLRKCTRLQYERTEEELGDNLIMMRKQYEEKFFRKQWDTIRRKLENTTFRHQEVSSRALSEVQKVFLDSLQEQRLGEVYLEYDCDGMCKEAAYDYYRLQGKHDEWQTFLLTAFKVEYLDEWINDVKEQENTPDQFFRYDVDRAKLKECLRHWIQGNIRLKVEWVVVIAALRDSRCLKNNVDYAKLCDVLNSMFPESTTSCSWESIRKYLGKRNDQNLMCNRHIDDWDVTFSHRQKAKNLLTKLERRKAYQKDI